jgi:pseudaminic acid biosynthesis-associated methylase
MEFKTDQEAFWAGDFGNDYIERNKAPELLAANLALFARILRGASGVRSAVELGANIGMNLRALHQLLPGIELTGVEINRRAAAVLRDWGGCAVHEGSILDYTPASTVDFVFTKGVLIHVNPAELSRVYDLLFAASHRYVAIIEYYNPSPTEIIYRGQSGKLFKRDFAGEFLDRFPTTSLLDYGFAYRRDNLFRQGDLTWFLIGKGK